MKKTKTKAKPNSKVFATLGKVYKIVDGKAEGLLPPPNARWQLVYWDFIVYFSNKRTAGQTQSGLPYYKQEDSMLIER